MGKKSREKQARREQIKRTGERPAPRPTPRSAPAAAPRSDPLTQRVRQLLQQNQPAAAMELLQRPPTGPESPRVRRDLMAQCLIALHEYDEAYPLLTAAAAERGLDPELFLALAETEANLDLPAHAERRIRRLLLKYPNEPALAQAREFADGVQDRREAAAKAMGVDPKVLEEAMFLHESTYLPFREGRFTEVLETARRAVDRCPEFEAPYLTIANVLSLTGETDQAITELQRVAGQPSPAGARATMELVRILLSLGRREDAEAAAERLLSAATTPETRRWEAETNAYLEDHAEIKDLLGSARDLDPRERFLLAVADANLGNLVSARRELQASINAGYRDPLAFSNSQRLQDQNSDGSIPYFPALNFASPAAALAIRDYMANPDEDHAEKLRALVQEEPGLLNLFDRMIGENAADALRLMAAAGSPAAMDRVREFAFDETKLPAERLVALGLLRDAGQIAEDEPVEVIFDGEAQSIVLGRHRILPDRPVALPDQECVDLFRAGAEILQTNPEGAYDRWVDLDKRFPSAQVRVQLSRLSQGLGRVEEGREWLNRALELDPDSMDAHIALAALDLTEGNLRGALEHSRIIENAESLTATELLSYQAVRENLNPLLESPIADALMAQADLSDDPEAAEANRELAGMLGDMQKSLALTQYLRQRPAINLREDLTFAEMTDQMDEEVIRNAAWLFGLLPALEELEDRIRAEVAAKAASAAGPEETPEDEDESDQEAEAYAEEETADQILEAARAMLAGELPDPQRLAEGLPGLPDRDLMALAWLLDRGGTAPLDEYLKEFPPDEMTPGDMLLENGIVAEGRLGGKMTRMIPADLQDPLREALERTLSEMDGGRGTEDSESVGK